MYHHTEASPDSYTAERARAEMRIFAKDRENAKSQAGREFFSTKLYLLDCWTRGELPRQTWEHTA